MNRLLWIIGLCMLATGCAKYTLVPPVQTDIGGVYTVDPQISWSSAKAGNSMLWTVDGPFLQALHLVDPVNDGEPLFERSPETKGLTFHRGMTAIEIKELVEDTWGATGAQKIETEYFKPFKFSGQQGFRFELTFLATNGLEKQALVVGSVIDNKLYLIVYSGARAHYFPKYKGAVEKLIASVKLN